MCVCFCLHEHEACCHLCAVPHLPSQSLLSILAREHNPSSGLSTSKGCHIGRRICNSSRKTGVRAHIEPGVISASNTIKCCATKCSQCRMYLAHHMIHPCCAPSCSSATARGHTPKDTNTNNLINGTSPERTSAALLQRLASVGCAAAASQYVLCNYCRLAGRLH